MLAKPADVHGCAVSAAVVVDVAVVSVVVVGVLGGCVLPCGCVGVADVVGKAAREEEATAAKVKTRSIATRRKSRRKKKTKKQKHNSE